MSLGVFLLTNNAIHTNYYQTLESSKNDRVYLHISGKLRGSRVSNNHQSGAMSLLMIILAKVESV